MVTEIKKDDLMYIDKIYKTLGQDIKKYCREEIILLSKQNLNLNSDYSLNTIKRRLYFLNSILRKEGSTVVLHTKDFDYTRRSDYMITKSQVIEIVESLENAQDQALIYCIFKGIKGTGSKDILGLRIDQIDFEKKVIHLANRDIKIDNYFEEILISAMNQTRYASQYVSGLSEIKDFKFNMNSPYLIKTKPMKKNKMGMNPMTYDGFITKIGRIKEISDIYITPDLLLKSGYVNDLIEIYGSKARFKDVQNYIKRNGLRTNAQNLYKNYREMLKELN